VLNFQEKGIGSARKGKLEERSHRSLVLPVSVKKRFAVQNNRRRLWLTTSSGSETLAMSALASKAHLATKANHIRDVYVTETVKVSRKF